LHTNHDGYAMSIEFIYTASVTEDKIATI
jgi:hypothetical protein